MKMRKIAKPDGQGHYYYWEEEDFEFRNPVEYYEELVKVQRITFEMNILVSNGHEPSDAMINVLDRSAEEFWQYILSKINGTNIQSCLFDLLKINKKKEQIKLLKGLTISSEELMAFIYRAGSDHGYSYSQYKVEHHHNGFDSKTLPSFAYINEDGDVESTGPTTLSERQIKQVIDQRTVRIVKFIDKEDKWHCFFFSFNSINGKETGGQCHLHYISSSWGLSREEVVKQLKSRHYQFSSLPHISYQSHRRTFTDVLSDSK